MSEQLEFQSMPCLTLDAIRLLEEKASTRDEANSDNGESSASTMSTEAPNKTSAPSIVSSDSDSAVTSRRNGCQSAKLQTESTELDVYSRDCLLQVGFVLRQSSFEVPLWSLAPRLEITQTQEPSKRKARSVSNASTEKCAQSDAVGDGAFLSGDVMQVEHVLQYMTNDTVDQCAALGHTADSSGSLNKDVSDECREPMWFSEDPAKFGTDHGYFNDYDWVHFSAAVAAHKNAGSFEQLANNWGGEGVKDECHSADPMSGEFQQLAKPGEDIEWGVQLVQQVEYYFSDANLCQDFFLQSIMDLGGWVALSELIKFPRLQHFRATVEDLRQALAWSYYLEMSMLTDHVRIRDSWLRQAILTQMEYSIGVSSQVAPSACNEVSSSRASRKNRRSVCRLATSLNEVEMEDADCVIMVHRVHHLGFGSADILREYCARCGPVAKVLLSNKHSKDQDDPKDTRLRPSGIAFIVMQDRLGAAAVLEAGELQEVEGAQVRFRKFVKHEAHPSTRVEVKEPEVLNVDDDSCLAGA